MDVPETTRRRAERLGRWLNRLSKISPKAAGRLAFKVFCTPFSGKIREKDAQFLKTARQTTLETQGFQIACYEWGEPSQPTVFFVHGWESNAARWRYFIREAVKMGFRVVAFDAPAHGNSSGRQVNLLIYMRVLAAVVAHFGEPTAMVGHSLGGAAIMQALAKTEVFRPKKAVILGSFQHTTTVFENYVALCKLDETIHEAMKMEVFRQSGFRVEEISNSLAVANLHDVAALFIHDVGDEVAAIADGRGNAAAWPNARLVETVGLGHKLQHRSVVEMTMSFLDKI